MLWFAQRRRLGVDLVHPFADVGGMQDAETLGIGGHQAVLDAVVHHLHEMPGPAWAAMEVTLLRRATEFFAAGRNRGVALAGCEGAEDGIQMPHGRIRAADHHTVAALQAPHAPARAHIAIVDLPGRQLLRAPDVVDVIRVAAVNDRIARLQMGQQVGDRRVHHRRRDHQPDRARRAQLLHEIRRRSGAHRLLLGQRVDRFRGAVIDDAIVTVLDEAAHHVGAHSAESNHSELHNLNLFRLI